MENTSTSELLKSLESSYLEGRYDDALTLLLKNKDSFSKSEFHYNYGTILLKKNEVGAGRYNLELASQHGGSTGEIKNNLDYAKSIVAEVPTNQSFFEKYVDSALMIPMDFMIFGSLLLITIIALLTKFRMIKSKIIGLVICSLIVMLSAAQVYVKSSFNYAVILKTIKIHEGPSKVFESVGEAREGLKVVLGKRSGDWVLVKSPQAYAGWIRLDKIGQL